MEEVWKPVKGYEGLYEVSDMGHVRGLKSGRVLRPGNSGRYDFVVLVKDGKRKDLYVHRIVANTFIPNPNGLLEVNHIDENRTNNRAENLESCTRLENIRHGTGIQRRALSQTNSKRCIPVGQFLTDGTTLVEAFKSIHDASRKTGYDKAFLARCAKGRCKTAYGYVWRYVNR